MNLLGGTLKLFRVVKRDSGKFKGAPNIGNLKGIQIFEYLKNLQGWSF